MKMDINTLLLSAIRTSKDEIVLTFQVKRPSLSYTVGESYTLGEPLFEGMRKAARRTGARDAKANLAKSPAQRAERRGRPSNNERIRRYIAEHGGTAEHAARALHIKQ